MEFAFTGGNGNFLGAQFRLSLLQAGLQCGLFALQRAFLAAGFVDLLLKCGQLILEFGNLILAAKDACGRLVAVPIPESAGEDAVASEQFASRGDEIERSVALAPGGRGSGQIGNDSRHAEQSLHEWANGGVGFYNGSSRKRGEEVG